MFYFSKILYDNISIYTITASFCHTEFWRNKSSVDFLLKEPYKYLTYTNMGHSTNVRTGVHIFSEVRERFKAFISFPDSTHKNITQRGYYGDLTRLQLSLVKQSR